jgi:hypothetical protein
MTYPKIMLRRMSSSRAPLAALFMSLAFMAMGTRAALPAGYMPVFGEDGRISVVVCSAIERHVIEIDLTGDDRPDPVAAQDCPFSVTQMAALDATPLGSLAAPSLLHAPQYPARTDTIATTARLNPQARAPPAGLRAPI